MMSELSRGIWRYSPWKIVLVLLFPVCVGHYLNFRLVMALTKWLVNSRRTYDIWSYYGLSLFVHLYLVEWLIVIVLGWWLRKYLVSERHRTDLAMTPISRSEVWTAIFKQGMLVLIMLQVARFLFDGLMHHHYFDNWGKFFPMSLPWGPKEITDIESGVLPAYLLWWIASGYNIIISSVVPMFVGLNLIIRGRHFLGGIALSWAGMFGMGMLIFIVQRIGMIAAESWLDRGGVNVLLVIYRVIVYTALLPIVWKLFRKYFELKPLAIERVE